MKHHLHLTVISIKMIKVVFLTQVTSLLKTTPNLRYQPQSLERAVVKESEVVRVEKCRVESLEEDLRSMREQNKMDKRIIEVMWLFRCLKLLICFYLSLKCFSIHYIVSCMLIFFCCSDMKFPTNN